MTLCVVITYLILNQLQVGKFMNKKILNLLSLAVIAASMLLLNGCGKDSNTNGTVNGQCQAGYTWNGSSCVYTGQPGVTQVCQTGYYWNGTQCVYGQGGTCPSPYVWNGTACVQQGGGTGGYGCPSGYYWNGFSCASVCPYGSYWNYYTQSCAVIQQCWLWWNGQCVR